MSFLINLTIQNYSNTLIIEPSSVEAQQRERPMTRKECLEELQIILARIEDAVKNSGIRRCIVPQSPHPTEYYTHFWSVAEGVFYAYSVISKECRDLTPEFCFPMINRCLASIRQHLHISSAEAESTHPSRLILHPATSGLKRPAQSEPDQRPSGLASATVLIPPKAKQKKRKEPDSSRATKALPTSSIEGSSAKMTCNFISLIKPQQSNICTVSVKQVSSNITDFKNTIDHIINMMGCDTINFYIPPPKFPYKGLVKNNPKLLCEVTYATISRNTFFMKEASGISMKTICAHAKKGLNAINRYYCSLLENGEEANDECHHPDLTQHAASKTNPPQPIPIPDEYGFIWWQINKDLMISQKLCLYPPTRYSLQNIPQKAAEFKELSLQSQYQALKGKLPIFASLTTLPEELRIYTNRLLDPTETRELVKKLTDLNRNNINYWFGLRKSKSKKAVEIMQQLNECLNTCLLPLSQRQHVEALQLPASPSATAQDSDSESDSGVIEAIKPLYP